MVVRPERGANDLHVVQLMPLPPASSLAPASVKASRIHPSGTPAYPDCPAKRSLNESLLLLVSFPLSLIHI